MMKKKLYILRDVMYGFDESCRAYSKKQALYIFKVCRGINWADISLIDEVDENDVPIKPSGSIILHKNGRTIVINPSDGYEDDSWDD